MENLRIVEYNSRLFRELYFYEIQLIKRRPYVTLEKDILEEDGTETVYLNEYNGILTLVCPQTDRMFLFEGFYIIYSEELDEEITLNLN